MKRVYCLYRVSTLGQVEKDDIPMQRQACHEFVCEKGWQIIEEFAKKGISGYKRSADQREALQKLKQAAVQKKFDVLLVFMFDRLGRRDDETPLIAQKRLQESRLESPNFGWTKYREEVLLLEQVCCMHCGKRLSITRNVKKVVRANGTVTVYHRLKYICINKSSLHLCNEQRSYSVRLGCL